MENLRFKFRAWLLTEPHGMYSWCSIKKNFRQYLNELVLHKDKYILMQFTGFKDKNGVEIYEGDIIEFDEKEWGGKDNIHLVTWDVKDGSWSWGGGITNDMEYRTVIGNIYANPQLLEKQKI